MSKISLVLDLKVNKKKINFNINIAKIYQLLKQLINWILIKKFMIWLGE